jgi:hypothetical protein
MWPDYAAIGRQGNEAEIASSTLSSLANATFGKVPDKPDRLDTATRMAMDADFSDRGRAFFAPSSLAGARAGAAGSHVVAAPFEQRPSFA